MPNGTLKRAWRGNRLVILPDYQNLGIGTKVAEWIGDYYLSQGKRYFMRSSHLRLRNHWKNSPKWLATAHSDKQRTDINIDKDTKNWNYDTKRICGSYEYVGSKYSEKEHIDMYLDYTDDYDMELFEKDLIKLNEKYYLTVITGKQKVDNPIEELCMKYGIRTLLLKNKDDTYLSKHKKKNIITVYNKEFSDKVNEYYNL